MVSVDHCDHDLGNAVYSNCQTIHEKEFVAAQGAMLFYGYRILKMAYVFIHVYFSTLQNAPVCYDQCVCNVWLRCDKYKAKIRKILKKSYAYQATDFPQSTLSFII